MKRGLPVGDPLFMFYASNEPKSVHARDPGDCRDNYEKLAERVSHSCQKHLKENETDTIRLVKKQGRMRNENVQKNHEWRSYGGKADSCPCYDPDCGAYCG